MDGRVAVFANVAENHSVFERCSTPGRLNTDIHAFANCFDPTYSFLLVMRLHLFDLMWFCGMFLRVSCSNSILYTPVIEKIPDGGDALLL